MLSLFLIFVMCKTGYANNDDPDMALLEFLGSFDTGDEQWFDPTLLADIEIIDTNLEKGLNDE